MDVERRGGKETREGWGMMTEIEFDGYLDHYNQWYNLKKGKIYLTKSKK